MRTILKSLLVAAVVAGVALVAAPRIAKADWNPADYTGNGQPQFNVYNDVPNLGNEHDFLRVGAKDANASTFSNNFEQCDGEARLSVYVHNGAPEGFNDPNNTGSGVAKDVKLAVQLNTAGPTNTKAVISSSNSIPKMVSDTATISCNGQPAKLVYETGSATVFSQKQGEQPLSDNVVNGGTPIGSFGQNGVIPGCWDFRVYVSLVVKVVPVKPAKPIVSCDLLDLTQTGNRSVKINAFNTTAKNGASFKNAVINWGDNSPALTTNNVVGQSHSYAADGTYTITAVAHFTVDGKDVTSDGAACTKQVTFKNGQPVTPPATPTKLADTGAGNIAGIFMVASLAGAAVYRLFLTRRLNRQ